MNQTIYNNISHLENRIAKTALHYHRSSDEIRLVVVGKTQSVEAIRAAIESGASIIGENYIQEARTAFDAIIDQEIEWHFIGHLQSNKAKYAVRMFDLIHTVDSVKLANELDKQAAKIGKIQKILVQINISGEQTKAGVAPQDTVATVQHIAGLENLHLKGFMTMPPFFDDPERARPYFARLRELRDDIVARGIIHENLTELSMGMTGDFEAAIAEGATLVRIGTAIFGERT